MWKKLHNKSVNHHTAGIKVSLEELIALRNKIFLHEIIHHQRSQEIFSGNHLVKIRGRGIEFDKTREYQSGDDVRRMAWRVTARSLKPHIKVYHEERERPVWLAIDLSPSLYFGTRTMFKSVCSIKHAALLGWSYLQKRERIGAFIGRPDNIFVYNPQMRERDFLTILKSLSQFSASPLDFTENNCLYPLLQRIQQQIRTGNSLYIFSDFMHFDSNNKKILLHLSQRAQLKLVFVYDIFEATPPPANKYMVTNGVESILFNMQSSKAQNEYRQQFQAKLNELIAFTHQHNMGLQFIRTDQADNNSGKIRNE